MIITTLIYSRNIGTLLFRTGRKMEESKFLFNDTLNTFYLQFRCMVKDHSESEKRNLPPHKFFYMHHPTDRKTHTTAFVTPVVEHWLE